VTAWVLAPGAVDDLDRLAEFLLESLPESAAATGELILSALELLGTHPEIGRPAGAGLRELVISRGQTRYLALYEYDVSNDIALVLRIRHQREQGYAAD
jgi:plasmid stabilization system protein ParE